MLGIIQTSFLDPDAVAIAASTGTTTWGQLIELTAAYESTHRSLSGRRIGVCFGADRHSFALLGAVDRLRCDVFLLPEDVSESDAESLALQFKLGAVLRTAFRGPAGALILREVGGELPGSGESTVTILTSGTTGPPKAVRHTWASLARPVRTGDDLRGAAWLLCYRPNLYAGVQVILQCLANGGTLVVPSPVLSATGVAELARDWGAEFASATPAYWRRLLTLANRQALRQIPLQQITLGGEVVDQRMLDILRAYFPDARLVHIYATTELGRCFSVTDGRAGFPARFLDRPSVDGVELRVLDGELLVRSANAMQGYDPLSGELAVDDDWFPTGDLVERAGDRYFFVGRTSDVINVGGNKVNPLAVEQVVQSVDGVRDARVFGTPSSLMGQLVVCEIVVEPGWDEKEVVDAVNALCWGKLTSYQRPRMVNVVDEISISAAGKKVRPP